MRYEYINFARGYAIFTIVIFHVLQRLSLEGLAGKAIEFGGTGVHLFFLLSGLGLSLSVVSKGLGLYPFYRRRLVKVWLPYVIALSLSWIAAVTLGLFPDGWEAWLAGVSQAQMFSAGWMESFGGHFWFISTIIQFYIVFPLLNRWLNRAEKAERFWLACLGVSIAWWVLVWVLGKGEYRNWNSFFLQFLWEFALGMVLGRFIQEEWDGSRTARLLRHLWQPASWIWWMAGGLFSAALMLVMTLKMGQAGKIFNDIPALFGYGMLSVGIFFFLGRYGQPVLQFFKWVGEISYSLYLVHILVLELLLLALRQMGTGFHLIWVPVFLVLALMAAWVFERAMNSRFFK